MKVITNQGVNRTDNENNEFELHDISTTTKIIWKN